MMPVEKKPLCFRCRNEVGSLPNPTNFGKWMMNPDTGYIQIKVVNVGFARFDFSWPSQKKAANEPRVHLPKKEATKLLTERNALQFRHYLCANCYSDYELGKFNLSVMVIEETLPMADSHFQ